MTFPRLDWASYSTHNTRHLKYLYKKDQCKLCQISLWTQRFGACKRQGTTNFQRSYSLLFTEQSRKSGDGQERIATKMRKQPVAAATKNDAALQ